jgi:hypothetical protein
MIKEYPYKMINPIPIDDETPRRLVLDRRSFSSSNTISYGLIVYAKNTQRWAILQRKHSIEFVLLIRGLYRPTYIPMFVSSITDEEAKILLRSLRDFEYFQHVYSDIVEYHDKDFQYAYTRLQECRIILHHLLTHCDVSANSLDWTWPKGRLHISQNQETPYECALREFEEEVEIKLPSPLYVSRNYVSQENRTIAGRNIITRCWIYVIPEEIPMPEIKHHSEVADRMWAPSETCYQLLSQTDYFSRIIEIAESA